MPENNYNLGISREVVDVFFRDLSRWRVEGINPHASHIAEITSKVLDANPALRYFLETSFQGQDERDAEVLRTYVRIGIVVACDLRRRQLELDELESSFRNFQCPADSFDYSI